MATVKSKKKVQRHMTFAEAKRLRDAVDDARRLAWKLSVDERLYVSTRNYAKKVERDLQKVLKNADWARMSNYELN